VVGRASSWSACAALYQRDRRRRRWHHLHNSLLPRQTPRLRRSAAQRLPCATEPSRSRCIDACLLADRTGCVGGLNGLRELSRRGEDVARPSSRFHAAIERSRAVAALRRERLPARCFCGAAHHRARRRDPCPDRGASRRRAVRRDRLRQVDPTAQDLPVARSRPVRAASAHAAARIAARSLRDGCRPSCGRRARSTVGLRSGSATRSCPRPASSSDDGNPARRDPAHRYLNEYDTLIIDEAHERSLNVDFLLGLTSDSCCRSGRTCGSSSPRRDRPGALRAAFRRCPGRRGVGRSYPVEVRYRPAGERAPPSETTPSRMPSRALSTSCRHQPRRHPRFSCRRARRSGETAETLRKHRCH